MGVDKTNFVSPAAHRAHLLGEAVFWLSQLADEDIESANRTFASWASDLGIAPRQGPQASALRLHPQGRGQ